MKRTAALLLLILTTVAQAAPVEIKGLRMWPAPDNTRLVFDLSAPVEHNLFTLKNPDRIVIDIKDTDLQGGLPKLDFSDSFIKRIRCGTGSEIQRSSQEFRAQTEQRVRQSPRDRSLRRLGEDATQDRAEYCRPAEAATQRGCSD